MNEELHMAERALRARWHRSDKTRREWVRYVYDIDTLRKIATGRSLI